MAQSINPREWINQNNAMISFTDNWLKHVFIDPKKVANPTKPFGVARTLFKNKEKLIEFLENFEVSYVTISKYGAIARDRNFLSLER